MWYRGVQPVKRYGCQKGKWKEKEIKEESDERRREEMRETGRLRAGYWAENGDLSEPEEKVSRMEIVGEIWGNISGP